MTNIFEEKTVIVTGGTSGIGFGLCEELLRQGAIVYVIGSRQTSVDKAKESLKKYQNARFSVVDVRDNVAVKKMVDDCVTRDGRLDYLFNNAGISQNCPYELITPELWKDMIDINLWGVIYGTNAALDVMRKQGNGHIINISSVAAPLTTPFQSAYVATKAAVAGMTNCLRYEYEPRNIFFTVFYPGNVATPIFKGQIPDNSITVEEAVKVILEGVEKKEINVVFPEYYVKVIEHYKDKEMREIGQRNVVKEKTEFFKQTDPETYEEKVEAMYKK
ncbi:MAG: SDR family NAD(P)-dependent oxidoreductase [Methanospirillum sp.]|nr:SDR family NAD(P)-dependent oxidoreductase [Methanospirillum sp.]